MRYFHVFLSLEPNAEEQRCVLADLSEAELKASFVRPFNHGKNLLCGNEVIPTEKIRRITITTTDEKSEAVLEKYRKASNEAIDKLNSESRGLVFLGGIGYGLDDLAGVGADVTAKYITEPPGRVSAQSLIIRLLHNPWIVGVGGGIVVAGIAAMLKWS